MKVSRWSWLWFEHLAVLHEIHVESVPQVGTEKIRTIAFFVVCSTSNQNSQV